MSTQFYLSLEKTKRVNKRPKFYSSYKSLLLLKQFNFAEAQYLRMLQPQISCTASTKTLFLRYFQFLFLIKIVNKRHVLTNFFIYFLKAKSREFANLFLWCQSQSNAAFQVIIANFFTRFYNLCCNYFVRRQRQQKAIKAYKDFISRIAQQWAYALLVFFFIIYLTLSLHCLKADFIFSFY